jgi:hypothetical protein
MKANDNDGRKPLHEGQERSFKHIRTLKLVGVLAKKEYTLVDEFTDSEAHDFAKIATRYEFLGAVLIQTSK